MAKFCENCGADLNENQEICLKCGVLINNKKDLSNNSLEEKQGLAGFILGLCSILAWLLPIFGYPTTICGIIFSAKGLKSTRNKGKAMAGLILSIVFLVFTLTNSILGVIKFYNSI